MTKEPWKVEMTVGFMGIEQRYVSEVSFKPNERVEVGSTLLIKVLVN
jgi:ribosome-associated toxin RatA of RatAB toxin-antitoxin module